MSTFDLKKFLINEGMTRVSRDRKRLNEGRRVYTASAKHVGLKKPVKITNDRELDEGAEYIGMEFDVDGNGPDFKTFKNPDFAREMWNRASKKAKEAGYKKLRVTKDGRYQGVK